MLNRILQCKVMDERNRSLPDYNVNDIAQWNVFNLTLVAVQDTYKNGNIKLATCITNVMMIWLWLCRGVVWNQVHWGILYFGTTPPPRKKTKARTTNKTEFPFRKIVQVGFTRIILSVKSTCIQTKKDVSKCSFDADSNSFCFVSWCLRFHQIQYLGP